MDLVERYLVTQDSIQNYGFPQMLFPSAFRL